MSATLCSDWLLSVTSLPKLRASKATLYEGQAAS